MSLRLPKRLSSKNKEHLKKNVQVEAFRKLGLEALWSSPLDTASLLDVSAWTLETQAPLELKDLPNAFLQRLRLLQPDTRSACCKPQLDNLNIADRSAEQMTNGLGESQDAINPLDLVTAVFMSSNIFLQQEMSVRMVQCQFAVPLVLPNINLEDPSRFLLWPLRGILSQWRSHFLDRNGNVQEGYLASTHMPIVSFVKLGRCGVSKSLVLNHLVRSPNETFLHRGMDGGQLPRSLSNGLVEIGWCLPTGDPSRDIFPVPVVISNLRGDAGTHEKHFSLLCQMSSAVIVLCGDLREKDKQLLDSFKNKATKMILIELSDNDNNENNENRVVGFVGQNLEKDIGLPVGSVLNGGALHEEELAERLRDTLKDLLPDRLKLVTLEAAAKVAEEQGFHVDEGVICKKVMTKVEELLRGLNEGSTQFKETQLPLQGRLWSKLAELEKDELKQTKEGHVPDPKLEKDKKDILVELSSYKMTSAMKIFTDALFTADKVERSCFLSWMKVKLDLIQNENRSSPHDLVPGEEMEGDIHDHFDEFENGADDGLGESDSFCTDSTFEEVESEEEHENDLEHISQSSTKNSNKPQSRQRDHLMSTRDPVQEEQIYLSTIEREIQCLSSDLVSENQNCHFESAEHGISSYPDFTSCADQQAVHPSSLTLEHFFREMGLIFQLTHISRGSRNPNVLRLPGLAADLLLYGVPLELMDGDASHVPIHWLSCVFAELQRRLPKERCRIRALTNLGVHHAKNAEVLSALFGLNFEVGRKRSTRGVYMVVLSVADNLRKDLECDFLLLVNTEGLCSDKEGNMVIQDNEMATVAAGLSDVLMHNIASHAGTEIEANITVIVNALLRVKECGSIPISQFLVQDEELNSVLQVLQLRRVSDMLQTETRDKRMNNTDDLSVKTTRNVAFVKGPWQNRSVSEPIDAQYRKAVLQLKQNLFGALRKCADRSEAKCLSDFMNRLTAVWDAVRAESFSIGLRDTATAMALSLLCTDVSQWETSFLEQMESWVMRAKKKILNTNAKASFAAMQNGFLAELKDEAIQEVQTEGDKLRSRIEEYLVKGSNLKMNTFKAVFMSNMDKLQEQVTKEMMQRLEEVNESHCSSTQLNEFEALLKAEQKFKTHELLENSKSTKVLYQDAQLEEEFESVWSKLMSNFDFRPSERDDITARVTDILKENLTSRGLRKHMKKLDAIGQNKTPSFCVNDDHFGYRSRLKHMVKDNNRLQRLDAQQVACNVTEEYNQFAAGKCSSPADFSDSYITELLQIVENALNGKPLEIRSAFEVDMKVYLCCAACRDFQKLHDRYAKDRELLTCLSATKGTYMAEFIYNFRKRDQCQRVAEAFTSMIIKPTVLSYIYKPLGLNLVNEIQAKNPQYQSPRSFHQSVLEELLQEDCFESFLEYLNDYDSFRLRRVQQAVLAHLSGSTNLFKWRQQRLGEIVGKIAAAVTETTEGTNGVLSDAKPLLERVCLTIELDGAVDVSKAPLEGCLFSITTEWDHFVTCLMELLAALRLDLAQEFSRDVDVTKSLQCLPVQPQDLLFSRVRGCGKTCPLCRAPCDLGGTSHKVHRALLHRPKGLVPHKTCSLSSIIPPGRRRKNQDVMSAASGNSADSDWDISHEDPDSHIHSTYWRYVLLRFNERLAKEYKQEPSEIPGEWKKITEEEALSSLKEAFSGEHFLSSAESFMYHQM